MKRNRNLGFRIPLMAILLAVALVWPTYAASISISPVYVQSYSEGLIPLGVLPDGGAGTPVGGLLMYEFRLAVDELAADEDFWTAIFNVNLGPGLEAATSWMAPGTAQASEFYSGGLPSLATYDSNGAAIGGIKQHWQFGNGDFGVDSDDLLSIIVEAAPDEAANRQYGELARPAMGSIDALGSPTLIGALLVRRTELIATSISISPIAGSAWGTYQGNALGLGDFVPQASTSFSGGEALLFVPEPSLSTLAIAGLLTLAIFELPRRRRRSAK